MYTFKITNKLTGGTEIVEQEYPNQRDAWKYSALDSIMVMSGAVKPEDCTVELLRPLALRGEGKAYDYSD